MSRRKENVQLASVLPFERKLETSDGLMYSGEWGNDPLDFKEWKAIKIVKRQNRSTQSAFGIDDKKKSLPNPVSSDSDDANLLTGHDTLKLNFSLRVIGNLGEPFACNEPTFKTAIIEKVNEYKNEIGVDTLALRYAYNIANGRFLWRNRVGAEEIKIEVISNALAEPITFNAYDFTLKNFDENIKNGSLVKLSEAIAKGLNGDEQSFVSFEIDAYVKLGNRQHVFPSQEMNMGEKKKVLFQLEDCAAMHNVKIGNAIRTIDDWYDDAEFPIAAEPFGSVTHMAEAFRKSKNDLYTLMVNWVNNKKIDENDKHYVVANLIRGGVFNLKKES